MVHEVQYLNWVILVWSEVLMILIFPDCLILIWPGLADDSYYGLNTRLIYVP